MGEWNSQSTVFLCKKLIKRYLNSVSILLQMQPIIYCKLLFYVLVNCHIPFKVWISFQYFTLCTFTIMKYLWGKKKKRKKVFTGIVSSRIYSSFLSQPLYVSKFASTEFLWLHKRSLKWWQCQHAQGQLFDL